MLGHGRSNLRKYELTYLVSDEVPESDLNKVTGRVTGFVNELGGTVTKEDIWGRRKLAYPIKKQDFATYVTIYLDLPATKAIEFEKDLRHIEGVLRQLMIVKEIANEEITLSAADIAAAGDIQEVVGGEKSFEAVEGETKESRSLMAKREEKTEVEEEKVEKPAEVAEIKEEAEVVKEETIEPKVEKVVKKAKKEAVKEESKVEAEVEVEKAEAKPKKVVAKKKEIVPEVKAEDKPTSAEATADKKVNDEVERLSKLNEELDDILKDEL